MSLTCIITHDAPGSATLRETERDQHLAPLRALNAQGKLFAAGPLMQSTDEGSPACGSMIIVDFDTIEAAQAWFEQNAYVKAGVYAKIEYHPYKDAIPYC
jgi:uncharacterized protein